MGDRQEELQASVELIWEYADEACKPGSDLRPDIENGKELLLAAPDLLKLVEDWVAEVDDTMDYDEMTPEYQQLYDRATELIGRVGS